MKKTEYNLIYSDRKTISVCITRDGNVLVRAPKRCPKRIIEDFLNCKQSWIEEKQNAMIQVVRNTVKLTEEEKKQLVSSCASFIKERIDAFAQKMNVTYQHIKIGFQKHQWGSCSAKGNLSFNAAMMYLAEEERIYILIHELCHRKYMNHSQHFWNMVETYMPNYRIIRKSIRNKSKEILFQL